MPLAALLALVIIPKSPLEQSQIISEGAKLEKLADGFSFTEGPAADKQGNVYFTDQPNDRILKWSTDGKITEWLKPCGRSNGMWFDHRGNLIACADEKNELWSITPDGTHTVVIRDYQGKLLNGPNDVWVRPDGGMYITDPLYARPYWTRDPASQLPGQYVFFFSKNGLTFHPVIEDLKTPNGIIGSPDGKLLYIGDLGLNETFRYHIQKDGSLTDKTPFCPLGSDGMTMDAKGDIYLSGKGVDVYDPSGKHLEHIQVPEPWVGHVCFGGHDHKLLFITASKSVYGLKMKVRGAY